MNLNILSASSTPKLDYQIELGTTQHNQHTTLVLRGPFGHLQLEQIEVPDYLIWLCDYAITETITIKAFSATPILQLSYFIADNFESYLTMLKEPFAAGYQHDLFFSFKPTTSLQLSTSYRRALFIHYTEPFISTENAALFSSLTDFTWLQDENEIGVLSMDKSALEVIGQLNGYSLTDNQLYRYTKVKAEELFVHFLKAAVKLQSTYTQFSRIELEKMQQVATTIRSNLDEGYSDFQLAKLHNLNVHKLKKAFKSFTGMTLYQYQHHQRLKTAHRLLLEREMPVSEISAAIGFKNLSNFSEAFKKFFGYTPTSLREKA